MSVEEYYNYLWYYFQPEDIADKEIITCFIAVLPSSEDNIVTIAIHDRDGNISDNLIEKKAPKGGFQAGHVYNLSINENEFDKIEQQEREALIALYNATGGDSWTDNTNWCSDKPLSEWSGVSMWDGHVKYIGLSSRGLVGELPEELGNLTALETLNLGYNQLSGNLPESMLYTSTDYSRDGEVMQLQKATQGKGIDLVFLGEAFVDKDMEPGGLYEQTMKAAMEQYFANEPLRTFRDRFNVYAVKVVSPNAEFMSGAVHRINENQQICFEYAQKVPGLEAAPYQMVSVIYNKGCTGRSYTTIYSDKSYVGFMMEGVNDVLNHEVCGHGLGKLSDEYVEYGYENQTLPQSEREKMDNDWINWKWGANVDWRNDAATVKWSRFLSDARYAGEGLGLYEGANLYGYGAYRPTENSMMRYNDSPFNAPSRERIYQVIMELSQGSSWVYDYEEFVGIDLVNRNYATSRALKTSPSAAVRENWRKKHRAPVYVHGSWKDAKNSGQAVVPLR